MKFLPVFLLAACNESDGPAERAAQVEATGGGQGQAPVVAPVEGAAVVEVERLQLEKEQLQRDLAEEHRLREEAERASRQPVEVSPPLVQPPVSEVVADAPVAGYDMFYDALDDYGQWFLSPDYGYVFQPTVVVQQREWRPYTRGRWVYSDRGWTWVSDEPFGWATYHYGRWTMLDDAGWSRVVLGAGP